jgi:hypothetical protein
MLLLTRTVHGLLTTGALATLACLFHAGDPTQPSWWVFLPLFGAWTLFPYAVVGAASRRFQDGPGALATVAVSAALLTVSGGVVLYSAFVTHADPQSGIVLVVLPLWQLAGLLPFLLLSRFLERRAGRSG